MLSRFLPNFPGIFKNIPVFPGRFSRDFQRQFEHFLLFQWVITMDDTERKIRIFLRKFNKNEQICHFLQERRL